MEKIYEHKDYQKYKDAVGDKFTPLEFKGELDLNAGSPQIKTILTALVWKAQLQGKIITQAVLSKLDKIDLKTQRYKLEWGEVQI